MSNERPPAPPGSASKIRDLATHPFAYVTVSALAEYWLVSRKQIYKQIEAQTLPTVRLGPRLYRIKTADALRFEEEAKLSPPPQPDTRPRAGHKKHKKKVAKSKLTPPNDGRQGAKRSA